MPPMHEVAHLAHLELRTPVPEDSLAFSIDWTDAERAEGQAWSLHTIQSFRTHGTPAAAS